jgi:N-carbamoylputrescine amidase
MMGAELLFYPTAIGNEPILDIDSKPHWQRCMQGHAGANLVPVIASNVLVRKRSGYFHEFYGSSLSPMRPVRSLLRQTGVS